MKNRSTRLIWYSEVMSDVFGAIFISLVLIFLTFWVWSSVVEWPPRPDRIERIEAAAGL